LEAFAAEMLGSLNRRERRAEGELSCAWADAGW
jgi:hypothetical protein